MDRVRLLRFVLSRVRFSVIVPLFNRPEEIESLLESQTHQSFRDFGVIVVEGGSDRDARNIALAFQDRLDVHYFWKENTRQGFTRNFGFERAKGDWFVVFDSDCLILPQYLEAVDAHLRANPRVDFYGGPDAAHTSFTTPQKAIGHAMTSPLTTGGIRSRVRDAVAYHSRLLNMGISRSAWERSSGYRISVKGEDIEFSMRLIANGVKRVLIPEAHVYQRRRTDFAQFWRQVHFFGAARVNIRKFFSGVIRPIHWMPSFLLLYVVSMILLAFGLHFATGLPAKWSVLPVLPYLVWHLALLVGGKMATGSLTAAFLVLRAARIELTSCGWGLLTEYRSVALLRRRNPTIGELRIVPMPKG